MLFIYWGLFIISPFLVTAILFLKWRKSIERRFQFFIVVSQILLISLIVSIFSVNFLAIAGMNYFYISSHSCGLFFICAVFDFLQSHQSVWWSSIYILFLICFIVMTQIRKPKWLGFYAEQKLGQARHR